MDKIKIDENGCWRWVGALDTNGYGAFRINGKNVLTHRYSYEGIKGSIPKGLYIDHLCRIKNCVNPDHLEAVTHSENVKRGLPYKKPITHCPQGHEYTEKNTHINKKGHKKCRTCNRERAVS
jgi:hypothetical protein